MFLFAPTLTPPHPTPARRQRVFWPIKMMLEGQWHHIKTSVTFSANMSRHMTDDKKSLRLHLLIKLYTHVGLHLVCIIKKIASETFAFSRSTLRLFWVGWILSFSFLGFFYWCCPVCASVVWGQTPGSWKRGAVSAETPRRGRLPRQSQEGWAPSSAMSCSGSNASTERLLSAFSPWWSRTVWEHGSICQKFSHVGKLWGQHGPVPGSVPAGRGGGQDGAAASGAGSQRLLHLRGAAGRLHPLAGSCEGRQTAARWKTRHYIKDSLWNYQTN